MTPIVDSFTNIYHANRRPCDKYYRICCKYARITELTVKLLFTSNAGAITFMLIGGAVDSIIRAERIPLLHCFFPMIDDYSNDALFALVTVHNICAGYLWVFCVIPSDEIFSVVTANLMMTPEIVQQDIDELSLELKKNSPRDSITVKESFARYMEAHQQFNE